MKDIKKDKKDALLIDWSALIKNRLFSLLSSELPMTRINEIEEVRFRIARKLYPIINQLNPSALIIAKDNKLNGKRNYWRLGYQAMWYGNNISESYVAETDTTVLNIDNKWYPIIGDKLGKAFTKKEMPEIESRSTLTKDQIKVFAPKYKGNRGKSEWPFEMTEEDFNIAMDLAANDVCGLVPNSKIIDANLAEADDIAAVIALNYGEKINHVLMTIDTDWYLLANDNTKIYNLASEKYIAVEDPQADLLQKIVQGDPGDGIKSTWVDGMATNLGAKKAKDIIAAGETYKINQAALERNRKLITLDLDTIPKIVQKNIIDEVKKPQSHPRVTWDKFTLTSNDIASLKDIVDDDDGISPLFRKHTASIVKSKADPLASYNADQLNELPF